MLVKTIIPSFNSFTITISLAYPSTSPKEKRKKEIIQKKNEKEEEKEKTKKEKRKKKNRRKWKKPFLSRVHQKKLQATRFSQFWTRSSDRNDDISLFLSFISDNISLHIQQKCPLFCQKCLSFYFLFFAFLFSFFVFFCLFSFFLIFSMKAFHWKYSIFGIVH